MKQHGIMLLPCPKCSKEILVTATQCPECGESTPQGYVNGIQGKICRRDQIDAALLYFWGLVGVGWIIIASGVAFDIEIEISGALDKVNDVRFGIAWILIAGVGLLILLLIIGAIRKLIVPPTKLLSQLDSAKAEFAKWIENR